MKIELQLDILDQASAQLRNIASHHEDIAGGLNQRARSAMDRGGSWQVSDLIHAASSILASHGPSLRAQSADLSNRVTVARSATADWNGSINDLRAALAGIWAAKATTAHVVSVGAVGTSQARAAAVQGFIKKYTNHPVDFDGQYGNQCMDLAERYNRDVVHGGATDAPVLGGDATDPWTSKTPPIGYTRIPWKPGAVPQVGDLVIWKATHIAIFQSGDANTYTTFDQNWPTGSPPSLVSHSISDGDVYGWLRPTTIQLPR